MQRLPVIAGVIKRRMLVNFRAVPEVIQPLLPQGMRPKLHGEHAIAGICLIRLEQMRPKAFPAIMGMASENAAHRIAVEWNDAEGALHEGVYIPRRDTDSRINALAGGRIFPGEHHLSRFQVEDEAGKIRFAMQSADGEVEITLEGREGRDWPAESCFSSLAESSNFFYGGSVGYSATKKGCRLDGMQLRTETWKVVPLSISKVHTSFFLDERRFPNGAILFDHALVMREIPHEWHSVPDYEMAP